MFSKWLGRGPGGGPPGARGSVGGNIPAAMKPNAQRYFSRGVDCNMKVVVRGDRKTGKSTLLHLLQGGKFDPQYTETGEIEVANISWRYKTSDDVVKVEVWDVVDHGTRKKPLIPAGVKLGVGDDPPEGLPALDAQTVDVYKGTHGVVFMVDVCKKWTYEYVQRELANVPDALPVLVLANFRDQEEHRTVPADEMAVWLETGVDRSGPVFFAESALNNGFGLMFVYRFFAYPFLIVQRAQLLARLESIKAEIVTSGDEIKLYCYGSEEQNYSKFLENREKRRQQKEAAGGGPATTGSEARAAYVPPMKANDAGGIGHEIATPPDALQRKGSLSSRLRGMASKAASKSFTGSGSQDPSPLGSQRQTPEGGDGSVPSSQSPVTADNFKPDLELADEFFSDPPTTSQLPSVAAPVGDDSDEDVPNQLVQADGSDVEISDQEEGTLAVKDSTPVSPGLAEVAGDKEPQLDAEDVAEPEYSSAPKASRSTHNVNDSDASSDGFGTNSENEVEEEEEEEEEAEEPPPRPQAVVIVAPQHVQSPKPSAQRKNPNPPSVAAPPPNVEQTEVVPKKKAAGLIFATYGAPTQAPISAPPIIEPVSEPPEDTSEKKKKKKKKKSAEDSAEKESEPAAKTAKELEVELNTSNLAMAEDDSLDSWLNDGPAVPASADPEAKTKKKKKKTAGSDSDAFPTSTDMGEKKKKKKKKKKKEADLGDYDEI